MTAIRFPVSLSFTFAFRAQVRSGQVRSGQWLSICVTSASPQNGQSHTNATKGMNIITLDRHHGYNMGHNNRGPTRLKKLLPGMQHVNSTTETSSKLPLQKIPIHTDEQTEDPKRI